MNKQELVAHLANLTFIMDVHERLGTTKNKFLVAEFMGRQEELHTILEKEQEDEARKRKLDDERRKDRPGAADRLPRSGESNG